ncbi:MAG: Arginine--tRNA ligase [Legionellaceae bacterium]
MKNHLKSLIETAITSIQQKTILAKDITFTIQIERTRDKQFGDFSCNIAMVLAKTTHKNPRELAELMLAHIPASDLIEKTLVAGPGFINFFLTPEALQQIIKPILNLKEKYGNSDKGKGERIHIEFVSSNPTGPLHVGHGRSAAYGGCIADILSATGYEVHREYYVNDAGRQMAILTISVWLRYLSLCHENITFPVNGYQGDYVIAIAKTVHQDYGKRFHYPADKVMDNLPPDENEINGDKEAHIDALISRAQTLLSKEDYQLIFNITLKAILDDIKDDLSLFGINYQEWFSEQQLFTNGTVKRALDTLKQSGFLYEQNGATWFRSTEFGDDKDRVVIRENGQTTYFASDIAYFLSKHERKFNRMILVTGSDHHGYIPRLKAAMHALGLNVNHLVMPLVQFAVLYRGKERIPMSTRSGSFVTLRQLREEVGKDAARFFYVWRKCEQHLDFDLELAKSQSNDNPVYYIQYAYARICSVFKQLNERNLIWDKELGFTCLSHLTNEHEKNLLNTLSQFPEIVEAAASNLEPHLIAHYLREVANHFHTYYNAHQFIIDDIQLRNARLNLIAAVKQVLHNGLHLLSVSAPEIM